LGGGGKKFSKTLREENEHDAVVAISVREWCVYEGGETNELSFVLFHALVYCSTKRGPLETRVEDVVKEGNERKRAAGQQISTPTLGSEVGLEGRGID
jgi:hypothetical protein